ncbi:Peptidyl-tRNA hydrolase ArfB [Flavobacterium longum]|uniref:alternative ribosome rescue aminoacyl-tRNA hydrolase ArfB n=1 Tax=Flavobacterium longum TaxID=1299340 RepID=UPI0039E80FEA
METAALIPELQFKAVRSSGPGGQNVNKVSSKVILTFDVSASKALSDEERALIETKLAPRLTSDNVLMLACNEDRSQLRNKQIVTQRFLDIIANALIVPKKRKKTKVPKAVIEKRIAHKKSISALKQFRKKPNLNNLRKDE